MKEAVALAQMPGSGKDVGGNDHLQQTGKLSIGQMHPVEGLELLPKILLQRLPVTNIGVGEFGAS